MKKNNPGFVALTTVLIVGAVVLAIASAVTFTAIGQGQAALALSTGDNTLAFVEGCAEDALLKLRASGSYAGGTITRPEGACTVSVASSGTTYTLVISTSATAYKRTIQVVVNRGSVMTVTSWREV